MSSAGRGIPPATLQQIRDRIDVVDVIARYVTLSKTGQNYKGLCPFHTEKSPSFSVSPSRQMFHCFGCSVSGDAFAFLMKRENLGFVEAARELAQLAGVEIVSGVGESSRSQSERERYLHVHHLAATWFRENLASSSVGQRAQAYLRDRGMEPEIISAYGLGYAPAGWQGLIHALGRDGVSPADMASSGMVVKKEGREGTAGSAHHGYDRFRDRIMFPIANHRGQVIAFGGRAMTDEQMPKYLNSPESPMFSKGRTLYGYEQARAEAGQRDCVVLVEGYFDVLALAQAGVRHVMAPLGTALTSDHVQALQRVVKTVLLFFDGDRAGVQAALRTLDLFVNTGLTVKVLPLEPGDDPDSFIRAQGLQAFEALTATAPSLVDFAVQHSLSGNVTASVETRVRAVDDVLRILQKTKNPIERQEWIRVVSERLGVNERMLIQRAPMLVDTKGRRESSPPPSQMDRGAVLPKGHPQERDVVHLALGGALTPSHVAHIRPEWFTVAVYRRIIELALRHVDAEGRIDVDTMAAVALEDDDMRPVVGRLTLTEHHCEDQDGHILECFLSLERHYVQQMLNELIGQLRRAEREHRDDEISRLNGEIDEWRGKKAALTTASFRAGAV